MQDKRIDVGPYHAFAMRATKTFPWLNAFDANELDFIET